MTVRHQTVLAAHELVHAQGDVFLVHQTDGHVAAINNSAAAIIEALKAGLGIDDIVASLPSKLREHVIQDTTTLIEQLAATPQRAIYPATYQPDTLPTTDTKLAWRLHLSINDQHFDIRFNERETFEENAALLQPLVVAATPASNAYIIDVHTRHQHSTISVNGEPIVATDEPDWATGLLRNQLINLAYPKRQAPMTLHAAGLATANGVYLFTGASGAGKSTLAMELLTRGFGYLGDDNIPLDLATNTAFPLPTAVSVKGTSIGIARQLNSSRIGARTFALRGKRYTTWKPEATAIQGDAAPVKALIFSQYSAQEPALKRLSLSEAITALQRSETRFDPRFAGKTSTACIHWLSHLPVYAMRYDSVNTAISMLDQLA